MKFILEIQCDTEPFTADSGDDEPRAQEVARILEDVAARLRGAVVADESFSYTLTDRNDDEVGLAAFNNG